LGISSFFVTENYFVSDSLLSAPNIAYFIPNHNAKKIKLSFLLG